jgi:hypothetical protein
MVADLVREPNALTGIAEMGGRGDFVVPGARTHNGANHPIRHRQAMEGDRHGFGCQGSGPLIMQNIPSATGSQWELTRGLCSWPLPTLFPPRVGRFSRIARFEGWWSQHGRRLPVRLSR